MKRIRAMFFASIACAVGLPCDVIGAGEKSDRTAASSLAWTLPIAIPDQSEPAVREVAEEIAGLLKVKIQPLLAARNPGCALWLRIEEFAPNPGQAGYVIILQPGGGQVLAANLEQLKAAVIRLKKAIVLKDGTAYLPAGLLTNYDVVE